MAEVVIELDVAVPGPSDRLPPRASADGHSDANCCEGGGTAVHRLFSHSCRPIGHGDGGSAALAWGAGVSPAAVDDAADPGDTINVVKTITTPEIPPKPDIVLLVDHTGSMGTAIASVKAEMANIISTVKASQPDAQFAVAQYCDPPEDPFDVLQNLTAVDAEASARSTASPCAAAATSPRPSSTRYGRSVTVATPSHSDRDPHASWCGSATHPVTTRASATARPTPRHPSWTPKCRSWRSASGPTVST